MGRHRRRVIPRNIIASLTEGKEFRFTEKHMFVHHLARLYAFAEVYNTPQLRQDVMTVLVELVDLNSDKISQKDIFKAVEELYDAIPSTASICRYLVRRVAVQSSFSDRWKPLLETSPHAFLVDMLMTIGPRKFDRTKFKEENRSSCKYHDHELKTEYMTDTLQCMRRQRRDGAFYASFLRSCLSEVSAAEDCKAASMSRKEIKGLRDRVPRDCEGQTLVDASEQDE